GWIKDDKVELNRAIKLRDNAFDALIDMNEKESKQLQAKLDKAINALRDLHDEQNGPPLLRREKQWQAAYDEAGDILKESDHES
ncbi:hypothetical protein LCGC14_3161310, partial [marine sediment metagenome]